MMINLMQSAPWTLGEIRALLFRQVVYALIGVILATGGVVVVRLCFHRLAYQDVSDDGASSEVLSRCRSELQEIERFHLWLSESARSRNQPIQVLRIVERSMPTDVWLTEFGVSDDRITVVGLSRSESSISYIIEKVAVSGAVLQPRLDSSRMISGSESDVREFRISGYIKAREPRTDD